MQMAKAGVTLPMSNGERRICTCPWLGKWTCLVANEISMQMPVAGRKKGKKNRRPE